MRKSGFVATDQVLLSKAIAKNKIPTALKGRVLSLEWGMM